MLLSQGVGKEGILYKEGTSSRDWKARLFQLLDNKIIYFETTSYTGLEVSPALTGRQSPTTTISLAFSQKVAKP